jgi:hypothetical protein
VIFWAAASLLSSCLFFSYVVFSLGGLLVLDKEV